MKLLKRKGYTGTICKIVTDDKTEVLGVVGTIADLLKEDILEHCTQYSYDTWMCIVAPGRVDRWNGFGATRSEAIRDAVFGKKIGG